MEAEPGIEPRSTALQAHKIKQKQRHKNIVSGWYGFHHHFPPIGADFRYVFNIPGTEVSRMPNHLMTSRATAQHYHIFLVIGPFRCNRHRHNMMHFQAPVPTAPGTFRIFRPPAKIRHRPAHPTQPPNTASQFRWITNNVSNKPEHYATITRLRNQP